MSISKSFRSFRSRAGRYDLQRERAERCRNGSLTREKAQNYIVPVREIEGDETQEQVEAEQREEQERINNGMSDLSQMPEWVISTMCVYADSLAEGLTEEEAAEKESLADQGFPDWRRAHFQSFIKACERFGRHQLDKVAAEIADKTEDEVRAYADVFFERVDELKGELACTRPTSVAAS